MSNIPNLPAETFAEGGESGTGTGTRGPGDGGGTGSNPSSMDYDEEPVVPYGSPDEVDILHDEDEKDDMYQPALDAVDSVAIQAAFDPNQVTAGGDDDDEYEYYYEDENGNIVPDNGYGNSPGGDQDANDETNNGLMHINMFQADAASTGLRSVAPNNDDYEEYEDSDDENEEYEHAEMYNKQRSTADGKGKGNGNALNLDSDISENMYGL